MKEQLNYEVDGKRYLLFQIPFTDSDKANRFQKKVIDFGGIIQGVADLKRGWFSGSATIKVLIPETKAIEFSKLSWG